VAGVVLFTEIGLAGKTLNEAVGPFAGTEATAHTDLPQQETTSWTESAIQPFSRPFDAR
jgi:hypothetical protein